MILDWILNPENIGIIGWILVFLTPAIAGVLYFLLKSARRFLRMTGIIFLIGGSGPLIVLLWHVFNAIQNALGLDSVLGASINLALFFLIGVGISYGVRRLSRANLSPREVSMFQEPEPEKPGKPLEKPEEEHVGIWDENQFPENLSEEEIAKEGKDSGEKKNGKPSKS